jgi:hypothetical protein
MTPQDTAVQAAPDLHLSWRACDCRAKEFGWVSLIEPDPIPVFDHSPAVTLWHVTATRGMMD